MKILTIIFFIIAYLFIGVCIAAIDYVWSSDGYKELVDKDYYRTLNRVYTVLLTLMWPLYLAILAVWAASFPFVWVYR